MMKESSTFTLGFTLLLSLLSCVQSLDHKFWIEELLAAHEKVNSPERRDLQTATSRGACQNLLEESEIIASNGQKRVLCSCSDTSSGTTLACVDACNYCSADDVTCGLETFGFDFNALGGVAGLSIGFRYIKGGSEEIFMDYAGCSNSGGALVCSSCSVMVDGETCDSCTLITCADGIQLPTFQCGTVEPTAGAVSYQTCNPDLTVPSTSVFEYLTTTPGDFDTCFLGGRAIFPTATPVFSPAPTFINRTDCVLNIGLGQCAPLLANTQPMEECDCYNYCDGVFAGCCALGEACDLECGGDQQFVAGCRFDGGGNPNDDAACFITVAGGDRTRFDQGESFGDAVQNDCGDTDNFPCFCDTITETDSIRCPYCPFDTQGGGSICAKNGETIEFVDTAGVRQSCECKYLGDNLVQAVCLDLDQQPLQECTLVQNTGQCPTVTQGVNAVEGCDCYNFCEGAYTSCCKYGEFCESTCTTLDQIVAGCEINPGQAPVTPKPTSPPVAAPRACMVSQNTQNCPSLIANQDPLSNCDCYNYCGDEFSGCCEIGKESECRVSCTGLATGEVLTAGCLLSLPSSTCKTYYEECTSDMECCSGRCDSGVCRSTSLSLGAKQGATKLSSVGGATRGGSGGGIVVRPGVTRKLLTSKDLRRSVRGARRLKGSVKTNA